MPNKRVKKMKPKFQQTATTIFELMEYVKQNDISYFTFDGETYAVIKASKSA